MLDERQSEVSRSGRRWEDYVEDYLRKALKSKLEKAVQEEKSELVEIINDIGIVRIPGNARKKKEVIAYIHRDLPLLYEALFIPVPALHLQSVSSAIESANQGGFLQQGTFGDADIVVYSLGTQAPIVVVSCKTSLHGRLTESLFYSLYYKISRKFKYVLATPDKGAQQGKGRSWKSEWGTPEEPSKNRILASLFLDGVYVKNVPEFMGPDFNPNRDRTVLGGIVRDLEELPEDIIRWYGDIKFFE